MSRHGSDLVSTNDKLEVSVQCVASVQCDMSVAGRKRQERIMAICSVCSLVVLKGWEGGSSWLCKRNIRLGVYSES